MFLSRASDFAGHVLSRAGVAVKQAGTIVRPPVMAVAQGLANVTKAWPLASTLLYVTLFSIASILWFDRPVAQWLKGAVVRHWEGFFKIVTDLGQAEYAIVPAVLALGWFAWKGRRALVEHRKERYRRYVNAAAFLLATQAMSGLAVNLLKPLIGRFRPRYWFEQGLYGIEPLNMEWGMNSFPSGHSQAIFATMTALVFIMPRYDVMWLGIAVLVAFSRAATTVHYLSDVVAGSYLAIAAAVLVQRWFQAKNWDYRLGNWRS